MTVRDGSKKRRGETLLMEGPTGAVFVGKGKGATIRLRAYRHDGDTIREAELAVAALKVFDAFYRTMTPDGSGVRLVGVNIEDDHPAVDAA